MGWHDGLRIKLSRAERKQVGELLSGGLQPVRVVTRTLVLRQMDEGRSTVQAAGAVGISAKTAWQIGNRYLEGGLDRAIYDAPRPGQKPRLDAEQSQRIVAMVCGPPPEGRARWTVRLIAAEAVKRKLVERVSPATVHILLQRHDLKPWREKMWCVAKLDEEYIRRMEDVLTLYEKPLSEEEPVVCIDEKPVVLHQDTRAPLPAQPARLARRDYEYKRCGTANAFCGVEPKAGQHFLKPTSTRSAAEFAAYLQKTAAHYPDARTIHLVMDNLNTHGRKSLTGCYGEKLGGQLWDRFTVHYTPKHGSWLNQAEIEVSLLSRQCLGKRRIGDLLVLKREARPWNRVLNRNSTTIDWKFTRRQARKKLHYSITRTGH